MSRFRASFIHLMISAAVVGSVLAVVYFIWYPGWYYQLVGVGGLLIILVGVDLVLGPALTLILFRSGKPGLVFDLTVIAIVQLTALLYGANAVFQQRPYFTVFVVDRFEVVRIKDIDPDDILYASLKEKPLTKPVLVYAEQPDDPQEFQAYLQSVLFEGQPDLDRRPEFWKPYTDGVDEVVAAAGRASHLRTVETGAAAKVDRALSRLDREVNRVGYVPISSQKLDFAMLVDLDTGEPMVAIDINPWFRDPDKVTGQSQGAGESPPDAG